MRSRVEVVADVADDGTPVLVRLAADGALAVRRTGPATVHLVGTAAGPLTGDSVELAVVVRAGATLGIEGVAATIALPGPSSVDPATWRLAAGVADGATLRCAPQPLVVCAGARLRTTTELDLARTAVVDLVEQVVLGRHGEPDGEWSGRLVVDVGGAPAVRQTQSSHLLAAGPFPPDAAPPRALVTRLLVDPTAPPDRPTTAGPATSGNAVRTRPAAGGALLTATGPDLAAALRDLDGLLAATAVLSSPGG